MDPYLFETFHLFVDIGRVEGRLEEELRRIASGEHPACTHGKFLNIRLWYYGTERSPSESESSFPLLLNALRALRPVQSLDLK